MALTKLTTNLISGDIVTSVNGASGAVTVSTGTDWVTAIQTANFTSVASKGYFVNTTSAEVTITLPVGTVGDEIVIQDYAGTFATNKIILAANGSEKIQGNSTDDFKCVTNNATVTLIYQDATKGWTADNIEVILPPLTVDYLVIAGGGGGGGSSNQITSSGAGGGGAGGYRNSYNNETSGGGNPSQNTLTLAIATNYLISIGAGGSGGNGSGLNNGSIGSDSSIASLIISKGGGGGTSTAPSANGGVGGKLSDYSQGYAGGTGGGGGSNPGAGGGGSGSIGINAAAGYGGNGGNGLPSNITGSSITRAAGGGGGGGMRNFSPYAQTGAGGTGGTGGGGNGSIPNVSTTGTVNTGGGGGGGGAALNGNPLGIGSTGGSGIVILRYPSSFIISGLSGTTTTVGTDKVTTFTNVGTGNIQFN